MSALVSPAAFPFFPSSPALLPFDAAYFDRLRPALHDYQDDLLRRVVLAIHCGHTRILLQLPTGGGKTHIAKALLGSADAAQFIVHRKELIEQTSRTFWGGGIAHSFIAADKPQDLNASVLLCGIATLAKQLGVVLPPSLVVWDECHHLGAATWAEVMAAYPSDTVHIGLTATPERLDGRGLDTYFDIMLCGPTTAELIERGFLSPYDFYAPSIPDMAGVKSDKAATAVMDQPTLIGDMVEHYLDLAKGEPGIVFAHSREHSRHLVDAYKANGVKAAHIDGTMPVKERERIDGAFRAGDIELLSNCSLLGEGYDVPGIVYLGLGRRTLSLGLYLQMVGRALRVSERKSRAVICDHAGNVFHHGLPDDERDWSLTGRVKDSRTSSVSDDADSVHQCLVCFRVTNSLVKICPGCGTTFPLQVRSMRELAGTLAKMEKEELRRLAADEKKRAAAVRKDEERDCKSYGELVELGRKRGYKGAERWATMKMRFRSGWKGAG